MPFRYGKSQPLHDYPVECRKWTAGKNGREWLEIIGPSYPDSINSGNRCDRCGKYSDYFVSAFSRGPNGYHLLHDKARLCSVCIMRAWFRILFDMQVP